MSEKISIEDVVYLAEKKLGLDGADISEYIYRTLERQARQKGTKFNSKYMNKLDLVMFRDNFIRMIDLSKLNPLDYSCFLDKTNALLENGSNIFSAKTENNKCDPFIRTVKVFR